LGFLTGLDVDEFDVEEGERHLTGEEIESIRYWFDFVGDFNALLFKSLLFSFIIIGLASFFLDSSLTALAKISLLSLIFFSSSTCFTEVVSLAFFKDVSGEAVVSERDKDLELFEDDEAEDAVDTLSNESSKSREELFTFLSLGFMSLLDSS
jgi:hypothetical protein